MRSASRVRLSASGSATRISNPPRSPTGFFIVRGQTIVDAPGASRRTSRAAILGRGLRGGPDGDGAGEARARARGSVLQQARRGAAREAARSREGKAEA